ncbi:glycolate oxidase FAD binding subunit [Rhodobium orientis]|uniref:2-hydroxy-acid oxidase n=1 Tax=Rhodobium orientis TaxID=34017 RepID=A0A327JY47_9HYPH|nr:FAD-binding protein [Rhodobium orientis]MBB4304152.1 glycolate oxidase FAD binding subunit [Rhodobium orientis]MBK5950623.1 2-hydroxy-acid oxidase [Rhodobium orientis]RAI28008.1 2-hydroxy-acid oxidase [Rhodobium orientis]
MTDRFKPTDEKDVEALVAYALAEKTPLELWSGGSKRSIGRPPQTEYGVDLSALSGINDYDPAELVLTAKAATPLAEIETLLEENNQMLAFEPADLGPLLGEEAGKGTLAGLYGTNFAGSRRLQAGAVRDHALGIRAVSGRGEIFKSGGRVMKNVTGYDLTKGLSGSWGTLAVLTELTFKTLPKPETATTLVVHGLTPETAAIAMAAAMGSSSEVSGAAHLPADVAGGFGVDGLGAGATVMRLEGFGPSVEARAGMLAEVLRPFGLAERLDAPTTATLWRAISCARPFAADTSLPLWRISVAPTDGPAVAAAVKAQAPGAKAIFDWAGGLVWLMLPGGDPMVEAVRGAVAEAGGGHATLIRADAGTRAAVPVFQPQPAALANLARRLKDQFDPAGILNPGRMGR